MDEKERVEAQKEGVSEGKWTMEGGSKMDDVKRERKEMARTSDEGGKWTMEGANEEAA